jgi:imidazole glycerol phosphate synthase glutamine amidotransferase subunit
MALCKRLIARLDIKGSRLIKGIRFEGLRVLGDPCDAALCYAEDGADELLYVDAVASLYGRNGLADLLRRTSREVFIPITAGGGVRSVADGAALLAAGADKIAVNSAALQRPELITELAEAFGSQCVVVSIQARRTGRGAWEAMAEAGRERSGQEVMAWIERLQELGAGEILLTSVDQDGTCAGPDQELQRAAAARSHVPLVLGGGFAAAEQVLEALKQPAVSAVSLGAALHRGRVGLGALKRELAAAQDQLPIRLAPSGSPNPQVLPPQPLTGQRIGVIDYGMGNQQSLINALEQLGATAVLSAEPDPLQECGLLALPGVGAFPQGMAELQRRGLDRWLCHWVTAGRPLLGICLGMQMLFEAGEEFAHTPGLGLLQGQVLQLPLHNDAGEQVILPHMGWNRLLPGPAWRPAPPAEPLNQYFVHSYAAVNVDPQAVMFSCRYGHQPFVAAVQQGAVVGFQFHPERSGPDGLDLLAQICGELLR